MNVNEDRNVKGWKNRIVGSEMVDPTILLKNPMNWRTHTTLQSNAVKAILEEIGWVQDVIVNQKTNHIVDGHLRVELAIQRGETTIPVKYVDLTKEEEQIILLTYDPVGTLIQADFDTLKLLVETVETDDENINVLIDDIESSYGLYQFDADQEWIGMPEFHQEDKEATRVIKVNFYSEDDVQDFAHLVQQQITPKTKYIWFPEKVRETNKKNAVFININDEKIHNKEYEEYEE